LTNATRFTFGAVQQLCVQHNNKTNLLSANYYEELNTDLSWLHNIFQEVISTIKASIIHIMFDLCAHKMHHKNINTRTRTLMFLPNDLNFNCLK
jgi:hypothetical protein